MAHQSDKSPPQFQNRPRALSGPETNDPVEAIEHLDKVPSLYWLAPSSAKPIVDVRWSGPH